MTVSDNITDVKYKDALRMIKKLEKVLKKYKGIMANNQKDLLYPEADRILLELKQWMSGQIK